MRNNNVKKRSDYPLVRESNMELLRLVSMYCIVLHHLFVHSLRGVIGFSDYYELTHHAEIFTMMDGFLIAGLNVFVLISGYFGIKTTFKGFLRLYLQVFFYGLLFYLLDRYSQNQPIRWDILKYSIFIFSHSPWWFITQYVLLYLFAPILNAAVKALNKKNFIYVLILLAIINIYFGFIWGGAFNSSGNSFINFIFLYMIARYVYLHVNLDTQNKKHVQMRFLSLYIVLSLVLGLTILLLHHFHFTRWTYKIWYHNNPLLILSSVSMIIIFSLIKINSKKINYLAKSCLAVYLIQDGLFVGGYLYMYADKIYLYIQQSVGEFLAILSLVVMSLILLFSGIFIDKIRMIITNPIENVINSIWNAVKLKYPISALTERE